MTAFDTLVAALRERHPLTPDLEARLGPNRRRRVPIPYDLHIRRRAAALTTSWLDRLNDEELELRLAYDEAAHRECGAPLDAAQMTAIDDADREVAGDLEQLGRSGDASELLGRPLVSAEQLRCTRNERARRRGEPTVPGATAGAWVDTIDGGKAVF
jgi:hypothetical protein